MKKQESRITEAGVNDGEKAHRHPFRAAHRHSDRHREEILRSELCRCFCCLASFPPSEIKKWVDDDAQEVGQTALCPKCGVDSVIGSASGVPMDDDFLSKMRKAYFT